ncbi:MAG: phytoene/squalene synthase family protein [Propionibacteriaceae bacterium]
MTTHRMTTLGADAVRIDPTYDKVASRSAAAVISGYSTSFSLACRLLRAPVRDAIRNVYGVVRIADEVVDGPVGTDTDRAARVLHDLEQETRSALHTGHSTNLVVHAFAATARSCGIEEELITPFFDSMRTDLLVTEHDQRSLARYIHGSAEVVGLMCLKVFLAAPDAAGAPDYASLAPGARALGAAFQKINFLRDLGADQDGLGRIYFPGVDVEHLDGSRVVGLLDEIESDLAAASVAIDQLPRSSRRAVRVAHDFFATLTDRVRATPVEQLRHTRVSVPSATKARIVLAAQLRAGRA